MIKNNCGTAKQGILSDDKIILFSKTGNNEKIELEVKMLETLKNLEFPIPSFKLGKKNNVFTIEQQYIKNSKLYKLSSDSFTFSNKIKQHIKHLVNLLIQNQMVISDLQFLYTDENIYIIDPDNIFFITSNGVNHFHNNIRYKMSYVIDKFNQQINCLNSVCI